MSRAVASLHPVKPQDFPSRQRNPGQTSLIRPVGQVVQKGSKGLQKGHTTAYSGTHAPGTGIQKVNSHNIYHQIKTTLLYGPNSDSGVERPPVVRIDPGRINGIGEV